ncbi:hypothetical protein [Verrucomicrobium spinosum]|uniref:hypothetical protein n=1 Tax=Verrucomicrobium spinosum TaxID=2736 RepID=UPI000946635F|nr:hypothetical protein [Verrucomicrobium spinosum]
MKFQILPLLLAPALMCLLASCGGLPSNTKPNASDMDRFYKRAEEMAQEQIAVLDREKAAGRLTQEQYDQRVTYVQNSVGQRANEMAWARHELADSQKRALGIPTGDRPQEVSVPSSAGSESFYKLRPGGQRLRDELQQPAGHSDGRHVARLHPRHDGRAGSLPVNRMPALGDAPVLPL